MADQPDGIGILDQAGGRRDRAGNAHTDGAGCPGFAFHCLRQVAQGGQRGTVIAAWRRDASTHPDRAIALKCDSLDLGAAEVYADPYPGHPGA